MSAKVSVSSVVTLVALLVATEAAADGEVNCNTTEGPFVRLMQGDARGSFGKTVLNGMSYASFKAIPYALPPIGLLRFKDTLPGAPWQGVLDATRFGSECPQIDGDSVRGKEDCLFLNVYIPLKASDCFNDTKRNLSVLVFIHGGSFVSGSSNGFGPDFFMETGRTILVTINYRLGVLGWLCLNTSDVPGNAALKDQNMALQWVRDNIAAFGGDPGRVTIFGQSAGGASVHAHVLSPVSAGLFHAAIFMSGNMIVPWALPRDPKKQCSCVVERVGCADQQSNQTTACLRAMSVNELVLRAGSVNVLRDTRCGTLLPFTPVVDGAVPGAKSFLPDRPERLMCSGRFNQVPCIIGDVSNECSFFVPSPNTSTISKSQDMTISGILEGILRLSSTGLTRDGDSGSEVLASAWAVCNKCLFICPALETARLHSQYQPRQYFYRFDVNGELSRRKSTILLPGVAHGDELPYLFYFDGSNTALPEESLEIRTVRAFVLLLVNFATTTNPTPQPVGNVIWPCYNRHPDGAYLNIAENLTIRNGLEKCKFCFGTCCLRYVCGTTK